jgi:tight adherence protein B
VNAGGILLVPGGLALTVYLARAATQAEPRTRARRLRSTPRRLPPGPREFVAARLHRADLEVEPEAALGWWGLGVVVAVWCSLLLAPGLVVPAAATAVVAGPVSLRLRAGHADRRARADLPAVLDLVVARLRAGGTVRDAVEDLAERPGPLAPDFVRLRARLALGAALEDALAAWGAERPLAGVRATAGALSLVAGIGGSAAAPLEGLAASLRADEAAAGEAHALSAQARMSAVVVGLAPVAYLGFTTATDPGATRVLVGTTVGRICLVVGLGFEVAAAAWMRAIVGRPA